MPEKHGLSAGGVTSAKRRRKEGLEKHPAWPLASVHLHAACPMHLKRLRGSPGSWALPAKRG